MRAYKRFGTRAFTLVELMIVVAIIGVLAALAIYGVRKYLASAKTAEAKNTIGAISSSAVAAYEREASASELIAEGASSGTSSHALCLTAVADVPAAMASVRNTKYQPKTADTFDFEAGDSLTGWKCLKMSMSQPIYYQYSYRVAANKFANAPNTTTNGFEAGAQGNLDGNAIFSTFARVGVINTSTATLVLSTTIYMENEFE